MNSKTNSLCVTILLIIICIIWIVNTLTTTINILNDDIPNKIETIDKLDTIIIDSPINNLDSLDRHGSIKYKICEIKRLQGSDTTNVDIYVKSIINSSDKHNVPDSIIFTIIMTESSFRNKVIHEKSKTIGLMQINYNVWESKLPYSYDDLLDIGNNIDAGTMIYKHYVDRYGDGDKPLLAYFGFCGNRKYIDRINNNLQKYWINLKG